LVSHIKGEKRIAYKVLVENREKTTRKTIIYRRIILKWVLKIEDGDCGLDAYDTR
jgi:hypothetical protein